MSDDDQDPADGAFSGGVSAKSAPAPKGEPSDLQAPSGAATEDSNFGYEGGPIISSPQVYASFWGASWTQAAHAAERANLVQSLINDGALPEPSSPSNMALMIFLDASIEIKDRRLGVVMCEKLHDTAFGYHNYFTTTAGHKFYYSVIPALDDKCLQESCPEDNSCSLRLAASQEQRRTQVASHEFSEMVTDPEISAWHDSQSGQENGDICNGRNATITIEGRSWTVQQMYSRRHDEDGAPACIAGAPAPIPSLMGAGT